jgi:hypothetical protein
MLFPKAVMNIITWSDRAERAFVEGLGLGKKKDSPTVLGLSKVCIALVPKSSVDLPSKPSLGSLFPEPACAPQASALLLTRCSADWNTDEM